MNPGLLTKEDINTIRIHINAFKEKLCNQHRWTEAVKYQKIDDKLDAMLNTEMKDGYAVINAHGDLDNLDIEAGGNVMTLCMLCRAVIDQISEETGDSVDVVMAVIRSFKKKGIDL